MVHTVGTEINEYLKGAGERPGYMVKNYEICVPNRNNTICSVYYEGEWDKKKLPGRKKVLQSWEL